MVLLLNSTSFTGISWVVIFIKLLIIFFNTYKLPLAWNKTFVALIPKTNNPQMVSDFCPISLCNVSYKVISKILATRLKHVIHNLVSHEQSGFIPGWSTFDNILAAQEIVHSLESDSKLPPRMLIKVDIERLLTPLCGMPSSPLRARWNSLLSGSPGFKNVFLLLISLSSSMGTTLLGFLALEVSC